jgi:hypothetical protein
VNPAKQFLGRTRVIAIEGKLGDVLVVFLAALLARKNEAQRVEKHLETNFFVERRVAGVTDRG